MQTCVCAKVAVFLNLLLRFLINDIESNPRRWADDCLCIGRHAELAETRFFEDTGCNEPGLRR